MEVDKNAAQRVVSLFETNIGNYLTFGYLYLMVLGVLSQAIQFKLWGINIIAYSEILDVILSPISQLVEFPIIIAIFIPIFLTMFLMLRLLDRRNLKKNPDMSEEEKQASAKQFKYGLIFLFAFLLLGLFIGFNMGSGEKGRERLQTSDLKIEHRLTFADGHTEEVWLAGHNINFIFYAKAGDKTLTVSPISLTLPK